MSTPQATPEQLASALAGRLIHDLIGPASGIVSAFDLIADPSAAAMRDEALALASESARKLVDLLVLSRTIYADGPAVTVQELRELAERQFTGSRATLELSIDPAAVAPVANRLLLGLLQIAAATVAAGGSVAASLMSEGDRLSAQGVATGSRLRVAQEVIDGLAARPPRSPPLHRWSGAYFLSALAASAGGAIEASIVDGAFMFRCDIRPEIA